MEGKNSARESSHLEENNCHAMDFLLVIPRIVEVPAASVPSVYSHNKINRGLIAIISMICRLFGSRVRYRLVAWFSEPGEIAALEVLLWCRWFFRTIASEWREKWRMPL